MLCILFFSVIANAMTTTEYVSKLEEQLFGLTYQSENLTQRIDRIEMQIYDNSYNGTPEERLEKIEKIYPKENFSITNNNSSAYYPENQSTQDNWYQEDYPQEHEPAAYNNYPIVSEIEESIYNKNYQGEDIYKRLARLEQELYGNVKSSESLQARVENLKSVLPKKQLNRFSPKDIGYDDFGLKQPNEYASNNYNSALAIRELELETFNRSFDNEITSKRIDRLENYYFGRISMEQNDNARIERLASVILNTRQMDNYYPQSKASQWAGVLMNLLVFGLGFLL